MTDELEIRNNSNGDAEFEEVSGGGVSYDGYYTYYVKYGDTFSKIAASFSCDMHYLANLNNIPYPYMIRVNQPILVPKKK